MYFFVAINERMAGVPVMTMALKHYVTMPRQKLNVWACLELVV
jgi:hypothetical protein